MNKMNKPIKYLIAGRTATGKSTVAKMLCDMAGLRQVRSYTTRPIRPTEDPETADHIFITDEEADRLLASEEVAAYTKIGKSRYFVTKPMLDDSDVYVIDPNGIKDLMSRYPDEYEYVIVYITSQKSAQRFLTRDPQGSFTSRCEEENEQFDEFEKDNLAGVVIENNGNMQDIEKKLREFLAMKGVLE